MKNIVEFFHVIVDGNWHDSPELLSTNETKQSEKETHDLFIVAL